MANRNSSSSAVEPITNVSANSTVTAIARVAAAAPLFGAGEVIEGTDSQEERRQNERSGQYHLCVQQAVGSATELRRRVSCELPAAYCELPGVPQPRCNP